MAVFDSEAEAKSFALRLVIHLMDYLRGYILECFIDVKI
jgi:hypothetical protein